MLSKDQLSECVGYAGNGMMGPQGIWDCITLCMLVQLAHSNACLRECSTSPLDLRYELDSVHGAPRLLALTLNRAEYKARSAHSQFSACVLWGFLGMP